MLPKLYALFLLLHFLLIKVHGFDWITCSLDSNTTYTLDDDQPVFLQTPNFPSSLENSNCNANFNTLSNNTIWIAFLNGDANLWLGDGQRITQIETYISEYDTLMYISNSSSLSTTARYFGQWSAIQAVVVSFDPLTTNESCPFSGLTLNLTDTSDFSIPISSVFINPSDYMFDSKMCNWTFAIDSSTQMLKVVVKRFNIAASSYLTLTADDEIVKNFTSSDERNVFYFNGSIFNFTYENIADFFIIVSSVSNFENYTNDGCFFDGRVFTNGDYINGYPPYQYCNHTIIVEENYESALELSELIYEFCCDSFSLENGIDKFDLKASSESDFPVYYILTSAANGSNLIFTSDGNTQESGYIALIDTYKCECAEPTIVFECKGSQIIYPMANHTYFYCSNMSCSYQILPGPNCKNRYISLSFWNPDFNDTLTLMVDENPVAINNTYFIGYYTPKNNLTLLFSSTISKPITKGWKAWSVKVNSIALNFTKILLNETTNTNQILWLSKMILNDAVSICAATGTLEMYYPGSNLNDGAAMAHYQFFDGNSDSLIFLGSLDKFRQDSISTTGCFTVLLTDKGKSKNFQYLFFKIADNGPINCQINSTVFELSVYQPYNTLQIQSLSSGSCEITVLPSWDQSSEDFLQISIDTITINSNDTFSFWGPSNNLLFSVNNAEALEWKRFYVYTPLLNFVVPPSSQININFAMQKRLENSRYIQPASKIPIQKGIMTSPNYNGIDNFFFDSIILYQFINFGPVLIDFVIKESDETSNIIIDTGNDYGNISLTNKTTSLWMQDDFSLIFKHMDVSKNGFLIEYTINKSAIQLSSSSSSSSSSSISSSIRPTTVSLHPTTGTANINGVKILLLLVSFLCIWCDSRF